MNKSLHGKHGVIGNAIQQPQNKAKKTLSPSALGLKGMPSYFKKLWQSVSQFTYAEASVKTHNKQLRSHVKFANSGSCRCTHAPRGFGRGGTCKKWMSYDKLPWCFVNKGCKGALKTPAGKYYRNC